MLNTLPPGVLPRLPNDTDIISALTTLVMPSIPVDLDDEEAVAAYLKLHVVASFHHHGGAVMGKVVDRDFKVKGVKNLRVVDASVLEDTPEANPQGTLMMLGRYAAHHVKKGSFCHPQGTALSHK